MAPTDRSPLWLALVLVASLTACGGDESSPAPAPDPAPEPVAEPAVADTAAGAATEPEPDPEAQAREQFFEAIERGEKPPEVTTKPSEPEPVATAPKPAPKPVKPAPKPAPEPVTPAPKPAPVAAAPKPAPVPLPKPTTQRDATPRPAPTAARTEPEPGTTMTRPEPSPASEPAVADVDMGDERDTDRPPAPRVDPLAECGDPDSLGASASKGALTNDEIGCLEKAFEHAPDSVARERVSVTLLENAYAAGDRYAQEKWLETHLEQVDRRNPEIAYRYALLLMGEDPDAHAPEILEWANVGLTHRAAWTGPTYEKRVHALYKLRGVASKQLLDDAKQAYDESSSDDAQRRLDRLRDQTRSYAREWYAYAKDRGLETQPARDLCLIAAEATDWCDVP